MTGGRKAQLRTDSLHFRKVEGELVVLESEGGRYLRMNETATFLWPMLAEGATVTALVAALVDRFDIDVPEAEADLTRYLEWLQREGLLVEAPG